MRTGIENSEMVRVGYDVLCEVQQELQRAVTLHPPFNSAHEGFGVLLDEVDELKEHVWKKAGERDVAEMRKEAIQVAAVAVRFALDIC